MKKNDKVSGWNNMVVVEVCVGSSCHIKGSAFVIGVLQDKIRAHKLDQQVELKACFCMGECKDGVCMRVNGEDVKGVNAQNVNDVFTDKILPLAQQAE